MKILEPLFIDVIEKMLRCEVEFMLIGGYAVNYYGYGRYTGDMDFWLKPTNDNKLKFLETLKLLGRNAEDIDELKKYDFTQAQVIAIGELPLRIDFLTKVNLVNFDEAWEKKNFLPINNFQLPVIEYNQLIQTKINTGRSKDKLDIEALQKIHHQVKENKVMSFFKRIIHPKK